MLKGFFTALSSKVFGSGQSEAESSNEGGGENSSSNAVKEKSDQVSVDAAVVSTEAAVQKKENLKEASTDIVVPTPDENNKNNFGSEVTNKELSTSVFYTKSKNDPSGQETLHVTDKEQDQGKGEMTDIKSEDSPSPRSGGNGQDMSEWVTLEMPKGKRSPRNRKSRSPKNQDIKSTSAAVSASSQDQKSLLDSDDVMIEKASSPVEVTNSKLDKTGCQPMARLSTSQAVSPWPGCQPLPCL
ncbi:uncharacterized protein LOC110467316 [Mizuhopecten yessoensis]|uniref:uncharacterized protein LOC110467316 n=1 Tax=Mizuhopecten yessoensis TaxID=6573 RepID=UPI000B45ABEF|nr:uncharacterized protein LOC110467316 [Mizuhopecten yessoensis]